MTTPTPNGSADNPFDFDDLAPWSRPFTYDGKPYLAREASADAARQFDNAKYRAGRWTDDGKTRVVEGLADAELVLLSLCVFEVYEHPKEGTKERPVAQVQLKTWPARVTRKLFEAIKEASQLDPPVKKDEEGSRKNGQPSSTSGGDTSPSPESSDNTSTS